MAEGDSDEYQIILDRIIALSLHLHEQQALDPSAAGESGDHDDDDNDNPSRAVIACDACERLTSPSRCFLDMAGCAHILCLRCLRHYLAAAPNASASSSSMRCPVRQCETGFFLTNSLPPPLSPAAAAPPEIYCSICMESKPASDGFLDIKGCAHVFCSECLASYVEAKVDESEVSIPCPDPTCSGGFLELETCRPILAPKVFDRWGRLLCESSIVGTTKLYCPYKNCSVLLVNEAAAAEGGGGGDDKVITKTKCPHCRRRFCAQCLAPWHSGMGCKEYRVLGKNVEEREEHLKLKVVADRNGWKRCPKCGTYVERVEGCVLIRCRCNHCFCYLCTAPMDPKDKKHYCRKCKCTWDNHKS